MRFFKNDMFTCSGNPIHIIYKPVVDEKGNIDLVPAGKENTDDIIQSFAEMCDMQTIIKSVEAGDVSVLNRVSGVYGDFTKMPSTYAEMLQLQIDSNKLFDSLPVDIKNKFDNDHNKFFAQAGEKDWYEKLGFVEEKKESEVKSDNNSLEN